MKYTNLVMKYTFIAVQQKLELTVRELNVLLAHEYAKKENPNQVRTEMRWIFECIDCLAHEWGYPEMLPDLPTIVMHSLRRDEMFSRRGNWVSTGILRKGVKLVKAGIRWNELY